MSDFADVKFDFSDDNSNTYIPEGDYTTEIIKCEKTTSKAGNDYLALEVKVVGEKYNGFIIHGITTRASNSTSNDIIRCA